MRIAEHAGTTDVGRQRSTNEDSLLVHPPYFAVADGMGGAKAGEVASRLAVEVLEEELARHPDDAPETQLSHALQEANKRIFELSTDDESRRGMGTTVTAARVHDGEVSLGHVGDSRAYRLHEGELEQLTRDHSLVAELQRSGQLSAEAAEHHPQRSIITRALGPEPDVEVDTYTVAGREGDVFLLCSDGLTGMVSDDEMASIVRRAGSLGDAAESLVRAANQSGGKDNITVVLFSLAGEGNASATVPAADETIAGGLSAADLEDDTSERPAPSKAAAAGTATAAPATTAAPPLPSGRGSRAATGPATGRRRSGRRRAAGAFKLLLGLAAVAAVIAGLYVASRQVYFVGTNDAGLVTLYRGVPYDLPFGLKLYEQRYASGVPVGAIPRSRRSRVLDHELRGRGDATDLVRQLERGRLDTGGAAG
ncbi:MAG TPA: Stp1/IreP family PP2C-type Ser/Thr phosphatase [Thermoleophilaceae bacterium]